MNKENVRGSLTLSQAMAVKLADRGRTRYPERESLLGKKVRNRHSGAEGTVLFSTFGISIGGVNEDGSRWQTLGDDPAEVMTVWEVVPDE